MASCTVYQTVRRPGISHGRIRNIVGHVLAELGENDKALSIHLVGDKKMRHLNRQYRGKDTTTDVLSFGLLDAGSFPESAELGDIFLSTSKIRKQAKAFNVSFQEECGRMIVHGILHLLGYDHGTSRDAKRMFALQEGLLSGAVLMHGILYGKQGA